MTASILLKGVEVCIGLTEGEFLNFMPVVLDAEDYSTIASRAPIDGTSYSIIIDVTGSMDARILISPLVIRLSTFR